jgi:hypothetical protein
MGSTYRPTCRRTIQDTAEPTPSVSNAQTNPTAQALTFTRVKPQTPKATLRKTLRGLGHDPCPLNREPRQAHTPHARHTTKQVRA